MTRQKTRDIRSLTVRDLSVVEPSPADPAEPVRLDRTRLLTALRTMRCEPTMAALRRAISDLRRQVHDPASPLRAHAHGEWVEFSHDYLFDELEQIASSQTAERGFYYVDRLIRSITEIRTSPVNDINLNRWKEYKDIHTDSLWFVDQRDTSGAHTARYWGNFIPQIPQQMLRRYTKPGEWVLDVFAGSGTTLIEGQRLGRNTVGIELQRNVTRESRKLVASEPNEHGVVSRLVTGDSATIDCRRVLRQFGQKSAQLVIMHPPYYDIIKFSEDERDLSNAPSVDAFLQMMGRVVDNTTKVLDDDRYLVLVIGDKYSNGEWVPLGFMTMNTVLERGFALKSIIVKNFEETLGKRSQKELWKYRALAGGFYIFKHEYIFVFKKQKPRPRK
jgi:DNA modification methylase